MAAEEEVDGGDRRDRKTRMICCSDMRSPRSGGFSEYIP